MPPPNLLVIRRDGAGCFAVLGQFGHRVDKGAAAELAAGEARVKLVEQRQHLLRGRFVGRGQGPHALPQISGDQRVFRRKGVVEGALADPRLGRDGIHSDGTNPLPVKQPIGCRHDTIRHGSPFGHADRLLCDFALRKPGWHPICRPHRSVCQSRSARRTGIMDMVSSLSRVTGEVVYLAKTPDKPYVYTYDPPDGVAKSNIISEPHTVPIFDMRPVADGLTLDVQGFALVDAPTEVTDFYAEAQLRTVYYREAEDLVKQATGASRVVVFDHTIRRREHGVADRTPGVPRQPVARIHGDYTDV